MTNGCTIEIITTGERLAEIGPLWDQLIARAGLTHPFLTHDWIRTWWECFGSGAELRILLVRADGEPIAIAPFMRTTERICGARHHCLRFPANDHTPRCDFIVLDGRASEAYAAICKFLMSESADWDVLQLHDVPSDSRTLKELRCRAEEHGFLTGVRPAAESPFVPAACGWDRYIETLPPKRRWFLRNRMRRLAKIGRVSLETVSGGPELAQALEEGYRLEAAAWKEKAGTAIRCRADLRHFYTTLAERCSARGWLRLQFLKLDDQRIAFAYCLAYEQRIFLLKPGFDPQYEAYSPGNLLCYLAIEDVHTSGLISYEFLGSDDHWKRQWTRHTASHSSLFLYTSRPLTRIAHYTRFALIPALRQFPFYARVRDLLSGEPT